MTARRVPATPPRAVAVVVPARNEEDRIDACLRSVRVAVRELPGDVTSVLTVVLDRCTDGTAQRVEALTADWPGAVSLHVVAAGGRRAPVAAGGGTAGGGTTAHIVAGSGVGALRDLGIRDALARLAPLPPAAVWVLNTDADTTVPPDWALAHLTAAATGTTAVAGLADLDGHATTRARLRHDDLVLALTHGDRHRHVYAANLGVRADAYLAVGGFPADGPGEDHALWAALREAGHDVAQPTSIRVRTSARLYGRAAGGLADLLRELDGPATAR